MLFGKAVGFCRKNVQAVLEWADCLVITEKPSVEATRAIAASGLPIIDVAGVWAAARAASSRIEINNLSGLCAYGLSKILTIDFFSWIHCGIDRRQSVSCG